MCGTLDIESGLLDGAAPAAEPGSTLQVVGFYDDFGAGKRVMRIYDRLRRQFEHEYTFRMNFWRLDALNARRLRKLAAEEAAAADVVFLATQARYPLPEQTKSWVRRWLLNHTNSATLLVALLQGEGSFTVEDSPVHGFLCRAAEKAGISFFAHAFSLEEERSAAVHDTAREDRASNLRSLEEIIRGTALVA